MLTVVVFINNTPIILKSARNMMETEGKKTKYLTDCGLEIWHDPNDGAAKLAKQLLGLYKPPVHG